MNELCEKYGDKLVILAFPTNQFGHQENSSGQEIINALKYVRPGNGFQPKCIMFDKVSNFFYNSFHSTGLRDNDMEFFKVTRKFQNFLVTVKYFFRTCNVLPFSCTHLAL